MGDIINPGQDYSEAIRQEHAEIVTSPELDRTIELFQKVLAAEVETDTYEITPEDRERVERLEKITQKEQKRIGSLALDGEVKPRITVFSSRRGE